MKRQILLSGPIANAPLNLFKLLSDSFQLAKGKWRLYWNYCPECNSYAPKIKSCDVCNCDTKAYYHWNDEIKQTWWQKYLDKHDFSRFSI